MPGLRDSIKHGYNGLLIDSNPKVKTFKGAKMREEIKRTILKVAEKYGIEIEKIILFGSRARGDYKEDSDWDVLVITKEKTDWKTRKKFWLEVVRLIPVYVDLIVVDKKTFEEKSRFVGNIAYESKLEGSVI